METIESLLKKSISYLKEKGFDEARRTAELLLAHTLDCNRIDLYLRFDRPLTDDELERFRGFIRRRLQHEPAQYIIGTTEFYGIELEVSPAVLIPRPETEHLVTVLLDLLKEKYADQSPKILDIGTGTAAIPIATLSQNGNARFTAIDRSNEALEVGWKNSVRYNMEEKIAFCEFDFMSDSAVPATPFSIVVSNPPYISAEEFRTLEPEINRFEPGFATCDGADGLSFYRRIAERAKEIVLPGGHIIVEIGYGQAEDVRGIFTSSDLDIIGTTRDLERIERVIHAMRK